jgi:hypothetical protein
VRSDQNGAGETARPWEGQSASLRAPSSHPSQGSICDDSLGRTTRPPSAPGDCFCWPSRSAPPCVDRCCRSSFAPVSSLSPDSLVCVCNAVVGDRLAGDHDCVARAAEAAVHVDELSDDRKSSMSAVSSAARSRCSSHGRRGSRAHDVLLRSLGLRCQRSVIASPPQGVAVPPLWKRLGSSSIMFQVAPSLPKPTQNAQ